MGDAWAVVFGAGIGATASIVSTVGVEFWKDRRDQKATSASIKRDDLVALQDAIEMMVVAALDDLRQINEVPMLRPFGYVRTVPKASKLASRTKDQALIDKLGELNRFVLLSIESALRGDRKEAGSTISHLHQEIDLLIAARL